MIKIIKKFGLFSVHIYKQGGSMSDERKINPEDVQGIYDYIHSEKIECQNEAKPVLNVIKKLNFEQFSEYFQTGEMPAVKLSGSEMEAISGGWRINFGVFGSIEGGKHTEGNCIRGTSCPWMSGNTNGFFET